MGKQTEVKMLNTSDTRSHRSKSFDSTAPAKPYLQKEHELQVDGSAN